jgi:hypothetical protein
MRRAQAALVQPDPDGATPARIPGQLNVDEVLALVTGDDEAPERTAVVGELVAPADELVTAFAATLVARPQTQRTYDRACRRFVRWLGPNAGPEDVTAAAVVRYHEHLVASGRASATVRKDRAALNTFLRWLADHELIPAAQVRHALAVRLPRAGRTEAPRRATRSARTGWPHRPPGRT